MVYKIELTRTNSFREDIMNRVVWTVMMVPLLIMLFCSDSAAADGNCGDNLTWTLNEGVLLISGTGSMTNFAKGGAPWYADRETITEIIIGDGISSIGSHAFEFCESLLTVDFPESLKMIEDWAFNGCDRLTEVTIPDGVTSIALSSFYSTPIRYATMGSSGAKALGRAEYTFMLQDNPSIQLQYVYENHVLVGLQAEKWDAGIPELVIPDQVTMLSKWAFQNCVNLASIVIPGSIAVIPEGAFYGCCQLTDVVLGFGVQRVEADAFKDCDSTMTVQIPNSVIHIDKQAFPQVQETLIVGCVSYARNWAEANYYELNGEDIFRYLFIHNETMDEMVEPTCEETGLTAGSHCTVCGETIVSQEVLLALGHDWGEPTYIWNDNHSEVIATRICSRDETHRETEMKGTRSRVAQEPTCTEMGKTEYTSDPFENPVFLVQVATMTDLAALGHDWREPYYIWDDDHSEVNATRICSREETHQETERAGTRSRVVEEPTCTEMGKTEYTTEPFENRAFLVQISTPTDLAALGHDWGEPTYAWNDDYSEVAVTRTCNRDETHQERETEGTRSRVVQESTCTEMGKTEYTSDPFENPVFLVQVATMTDLAALGHDWEEPTYVWNDDHSEVTATRICSRDETHRETETVSAMAEITLSPTKTTAGQRTYISTAFENTAFTPQQVIAVDLPALNMLDMLWLPESVSKIGDEAFEGDAFQGVIIPDGCASIGSRAFANCENLRYVYIPESVTEIEDDAFLDSKQVVIDRQ